MISGHWSHDDDADSGPDDAPDPLLRPVWEAEPDETDFSSVTARLAGWPAAPVAPPANDRLAGIDLPALLGPLCDAQDVLARLDARAGAAGPKIREGLMARLAYAEAAGWLAHAQAWVHPLDLALRDLDLTGSYAVAAAGGGARVMPHTYGGGERQAGWDEQPFDAMADADRAVSDALALARLLRQLAASKTDRFASAAAAETMLAVFGAGALDAPRFREWRAAFAPAPVSPRRFARVGQGRGERLPALLLAALAAPAWLEAGIAEPPTPLQALLVAVGLLARSGGTRGLRAGLGGLSVGRLRRARRAADLAQRSRRSSGPARPGGQLAGGVSAAGRGERTVWIA
jgi:hypothetical protein